MKIYIKNMVCDRCIYMMKKLLTELDLHPVSIALGEVDLGDQALGDDQLDRLRQQIEPLGFELISDKKRRLIESIKSHIIELVQNPQAVEKTRLSDYLANRIYRDYSHLSNLFSSVEGVTIEHYFINQKIEKAKELLMYDEQTLTEIAHRLGYSSVAHLSRQFKTVTGQTPSQFKALRSHDQRKPLDKV